VLRMNDDVEQHRPENMIRQNSGKSQKLLRARCGNSKDEIGVLQNLPHIREGAAGTPPLVLIERMKLPDLIFSKSIDDGIWHRLVHGGVAVSVCECAAGQGGGLDFAK